MTNESLPYGGTCETSFVEKKIFLISYAKL